MWIYLVSLLWEQTGREFALCINLRWSNLGHVTVNETICCHDMSCWQCLWPYYMSREFLHAQGARHCCLCLHPSDTSCDFIHSTIMRLLIHHHMAFIVISGDFSHVTLNSTLVISYQWITPSGWTGEQTSCMLLWGNKTVFYELHLLHSGLIGVSLCPSKTIH